MKTTKIDATTTETTTRAAATLRRLFPRVAVAALLAGGLALAAGCVADTDETGADQAAGDESVGEAEQRWDTESYSDESQSTHLFIVNRALDILEKHADPATGVNAQVTSQFLYYFRSSPACKSAWQHGLTDPDFKAVYNGGNWNLPLGASEAEVVASGATYESHFWDPNTGLNYKGHSSPTAKTEAHKHFQQAINYATQGNWANAMNVFACDYNQAGSGGCETNACYEMGLALHYLTDTTQPMHAANFTAVDVPLGYHSTFETYAREIQNNYVCPDWTSACDGVANQNQGFPSGTDQDIQAAAALYARSYNASLITKANNVCLDEECCLHSTGTLGEHNACWKKAGDSWWVGPELNYSLKNAQRATAQYIWRWFASLDAAGVRVPTDWNGAGVWTSPINVTGHPSWASDPSYYRTLRVVDINADKEPDLCGRLDNGVYCSINKGPMQLVYSADFTNSGGYLPAKYGSTLQFPDINNDGRPDICARGSAGIRCVLNQTPAGQGVPSFGNASSQVYSPALSDSAGYGVDETYYGTIRFPDVNGDGKTDICVRSSAGVQCLLGPSFTATLGTTAFSNVDGWVWPSYAGTIQFPDVNGDGKADVCGRGTAGVYCALSTGTSFSATSLWNSEFSDAANWGQELYWRSLRFVDIDRDGRADICGKGYAGVVCALASRTTSSFEPSFTSYAGFDSTQGPTIADGATFQFADVNGDHKLDLVGLLSAVGPGMFAGLAK